MPSSRKVTFSRRHRLGSIAVGCGNGIEPDVVDPEVADRSLIGKCTRIGSLTGRRLLGRYAACDWITPLDPDATF
jgi:hypothetical protein